MVPDVSVVLPTFNEAGSIVPLIASIRSHLDRADLSHEVVLIDDGSPDGTASVVESAYPSESDVTVVRRSGTPGLAVSIREGLGRARARIVVVMDSDFNHDPADVPRLVAELERCDIASGSRFVRGGGMYSAGRHYGSRWMNRFIRVALRTSVTDSLAGYFAIRRALLTRLPGDRIFWGYGDYFIRLLWYAEREGARIQEIPVVYPPRIAGESKTRFLRTSVRYIYEVLRLALASK